MSLEYVERTFGESSRQKLSNTYGRLILQDTMTNICGRLKLMKLCRNETVQNKAKISSFIKNIEQTCLSALKEGQVQLCAIFEESMQSFLKKHYFAAYFIPFTATDATLRMKSDIENTFKLSNQIHHMPKDGLWITIDSGSDESLLKAICPSAFLTLRVKKLISRFNETEMLEKSPSKNCLVDVKGTPAEQLQWVGKITDFHRQNIVKQFATHDDLFDNSTSKVTPKSEYKYFNNNCGTFLKFMMGLKGMSLSNTFCDKAGFYNVKDNFLKKVDERADDSNYIENFVQAQLDLLLKPLSESPNVYKERI